MSKLPFKAIAAMGENRVIGCDGKLPWQLPEELKWFKEKTMGQVIVMGRNTFESIGKALPGRENVVVSKTMPPTPGIMIVPDVQTLTNFSTDKEIWICGGAKLYESTLPFCEELFLTVVHQKPEGDVFFPNFEDSFRETELVRETEAFTIKRYVNYAAL